MSGRSSGTGSPPTVPPLTGDEAGEPLKNAEHVAAADQAIRPAKLIAVATLLSRILGLVRDKVTVFVFSRETADALLLAWSIPNLFRRLFGEGALSAALMPVLARAERRGGAPARLAALRSVVCALVLFLVPLCAVMVGVLLLVPERSLLRLFESEQVGRETLTLLRLMLPYLVFVCIAAQVQTFANIVGRFFVQALAPALLNVLWIAFAFIAAARSAEAADARWIAAAVLMGGAAQLLMQYWDLTRAGVRLRAAPVWSEDVRDVVMAAVPMFVGLAASQVNLLLDRWIAERFVEGNGAVAQLYLGNRLMQLPLGLVGVALGTAAFPVIARAAASENHGALSGAITAALRTTWFLGLPAAIGLVVLARPIMDALFLGGRFGERESLGAAHCLMAYAPTIIFQSAVLLLARVEYARRRQNRVARISLGCVALDLMLNFALVFSLGKVGLALATTIAALANALLLAIGIRMGDSLRWGRQLLIPLLRTAAAGLVMLGVVLVVRMAVGKLGLPTWWRIPGGAEIPAGALVELLTSMLLGIAAYFAAAGVFAREERTEFFNLFKRRRPPAQ